jgi:hypothetical protein
MKKTITQNDFVEAFTNSFYYRNRFSFVGLEKLFQALEEWEKDLGEERELDIVEIASEYTEATPKEIAHDYELGIDENDDRVLEKVLEELPNQTFVVCSFKDEKGEDKIIYANF